MGDGIALIVSAVAVFGWSSIHAQDQGLNFMPLARATFPDNVKIQVQVQTKDGHPSNRVQMLQDPDRVHIWVDRMEPGAVFDWSVNPGPSIRLVIGGELTAISGSDCVARTYRSVPGTGPFVGKDGEAFVFVGNEPYRLENRTSEDVHVYTILLGIPAFPRMLVDDPCT